MARPRSTKTDAQQHGEKTAADAARRRRLTAAGQEIGPLPKVVNPRRKARCAKSLRLHIETYLRRPGKFDLPWSADHLTVIARLEYAVLRGGLYCLAMFRGSGKTSLCEAAAQWAVMHGHRSFVVLLGATADAATELLDSIKVEVETNDLYLDDFPEVCFAVRKLEGNNNRAMGQKLDGRRTRIVWKDAKVVLPTAKGSAASGARIYVAGITGRVRGMKATTADGKSLRPDLCIADDPQTDESSESVVMTNKRERTLRGAVKGLAGPGVSIAMAVPCTPITRNDLADRLLDRKRNPQFKGERFPLVIAFPKSEPLWDDYARLRRESLESGGNGEPATEFYRQNRAAMDEGAVISWAERYDRGSELSAVQAALNLKFDNPWEFASEYQMCPLDENAGAVSKVLYADEIVRRLNKVPRLMVPRECSRLVSFIDCGGEILWYVVAGWDERFGGGIIDHGTWPAQGRPTFAANDPKPGLSEMYRGLSEEQRVYAGLTDLTNLILGRKYHRHDTGEALTIELCLVDHGWKDSVVYQFCRESPYSNILIPSQGHAAKSSNPTPMTRWQKRAGERWSLPNQPPWRLGPVGSGKGRHVIFDADEWKTFTAERLLTPPGGGGCLKLFGDQPAAHQLFADHCTAEMAAPVTLGGRTFDKWGKRPGRSDNHFWDATVGVAVAVAVAGLEWSAGLTPPGPKPEPRKVRKFSEIQAAKLAAMRAGAGRRG